MKKRKLASILLALIMVMAIATTSASASSRSRPDPDANIPENVIPDLILDVAVDDVLVRGVDVYQGFDGYFRVSSYEDLEKIFPSELYNISISYVPRDGLVLDQYIKLFGYTADVTNSTLNIYTAAPTQTFEVYYNNFYKGTAPSEFILKIPDNCQTIYYGNRLYINDDGNLPVEIMVNGTLVQFPDQQPMVVKPGRTMVPIRAVAELLGCKVEWIDEYHCAAITRDRTTMYISPGKDTYILNNQHYSLDAPAKVINGRTMVPLRFVAEAFGFEVNYQAGIIGMVTLD